MCNCRKNRQVLQPTQVEPPVPAPTPEPEPVTVDVR